MTERSKENKTNGKDWAVLDTDIRIDGANQIPPKPGVFCSGWNVLTNEERETWRERP